MRDCIRSAKPVEIQKRLRGSWPDWYRECMVRRTTAREKLGGETTGLRKCIRPLMEIALLAMMSCARVCPYKSVGRRRPFSGPGCRHAIVTVLSSLLFLCRPQWSKLKRRCSARRVERSTQGRGAFAPYTGRYVFIPLDSTAQAIRPACWPWRPQRHSWELWRQAHRARPRTGIDLA